MLMESSHHHPGELGSLSLSLSRRVSLEQINRWWHKSSLIGIRIREGKSSASGGHTLRGYLPLYKKDSNLGFVVTTGVSSMLAHH